ncbi:S-4TM family putative pore-forming effector [Pseudactinotalea sp. Z1732]|uniref:S-4TM family putative pore-forming effector n=1 Tax=Micrococcales TaxID=85006 RepID=UPI003C7CC14A
MNDSTQRTISALQNTEHAQRLLAAQSRLYTDAKRVHDTRVLTVAALALVTVVVALAVPQGRVVVGAVGGTVTFLWSVLGGAREKRCRKQAAFVQEEFDTFVFDMPWNALAAEHPSPTLIAEAASRYRGGRTKDWYPDASTVARPLDILICQRSNLGWGASIHRLYAATITGLLVALVLVGVTVALVGNLTAADALVALAMPLLGPARELIEMIRSNRESSDSKSNVETKVHGLWEQTLRRDDPITIADCRAVQDQILVIRQTNAHVPDWLDGLRRNRSEIAMQQSATHLIEEAQRHGKTR